MTVFFLALLQMLYCHMEVLASVFIYLRGNYWPMDRNALFSKQSKCCFVFPDFIGTGSLEPVCRSRND